MSGQSPSTTPSRKVYRFALYGVSAAGKTCLLAALGMNRKPNPQGYEAVRLPYGGPTQNATHEASSSDDLAAAARRGEQWLDEAVDELQKGRVPPPNPISEELMTYWFDFSAPDRTWHVELFDYSGELVNARNAADPKTLAAKLKEHLKAMDGLLVLVAAPHRDDSLESSHQELRLLKEAFTALRAEDAGSPVLEKPVALLFNKWDRQSEKISDVESERIRLEGFLKNDRHAAWQGLAQAIQNGVVSKFFEIFPVSAFGKHQRVQLKDRTIERPEHPEELRAFGLEDPFVWAARTIDKRDLTEYEHQSKPWIGSPWNAVQMIQKGGKLIHRFAPITEEHERAKKARSQWRFVAGVRSVVAILCVMLIGCSIEYLFDVEDYRETIAVIEDGKATSEQMNEAETWLMDYSKSPCHRHLGLAIFVISRDEAAETLREFRELQEGRLWSRVENAPSESGKYEAARDYLGEFPAGGHAGEAETLVVEHERRLRMQENKDWLATREAAAGPLLVSDSIPELKQALDNLRHPPHSGVADDNFLTRRTELRNRLSKHLTDLYLKKDWEQFLVGYQEAMEQRRFDDAARMLQTREPVSEDLQQVRKQFANVLPNELKQAVDDWIQKRFWEDARSLLTNLIRDHVQWPAEMRFEGVVEFLEDQRKRVTSAHDRSLYQQFRKFRTEDTARSYLERESPGPMQPDVKKYLTYLEARKQKHNFTVVLEAIEWPEDYPEDDDNWIRFKAEGELASEVEEVNSTPEGKTGEVGRYQLDGPRSLNSSVKLNVEIVNVENLFWIDRLWQDVNAGEGMESVKLSQLDGYRQKLKAGKWGQCVAHYRLIGGELARTEPELPPWRRQ